MDTDARRNGATSQDDPYVGEYPGVCGGYPVIRGTRISVRIVVGLHQQGASADELHDMWPHVSKEQIQGSLDYYARYPSRVDEDIERHERVYAEAHGLPWPA